MSVFVANFISPGQWCLWNGDPGGGVCIGQLPFLEPEMSARSATATCLHLTGVLHVKNGLHASFRREKSVVREMVAVNTFSMQFPRLPCFFPSHCLDSPAVSLLRLGTPRERRSTRNSSRPRKRTSDLPPLEEEVGIPTSPLTV